MSLQHVYMYGGDIIYMLAQAWVCGGGGVIDVQKVIYWVFE